MEHICYTPIGIIHSPHKKEIGIPIQPAFALDIQGNIEIFPDFAEGLKDLEGFSHIILICHFHESRKYKLHVRPFLDEDLHGVFATRAPKRPNAIGLSIVRLIRISGLNIFFAGNDILDQTPLLDIKPYVPDFDAYNDCETGWYDKASRNNKPPLSDDRFLR